MTPQPLNFDSSGWGIGIAHAPSPNDNGGLTAPMDGVVMHTMVGDNAWAYFEQSSAQVSAHFTVEQDGMIHQCVSVQRGQADEAWAEEAGNNMYFSIEHADHGNPHNPLTELQMEGSARIVEALSHGVNALGGFPLRVGAFAGDKGYVCHYMGGAAWGGHSCPDYPVPGTPFARSTQRADIIKIAQAIRNVRTGKRPPIDPGEWVAHHEYRHVANGTVSLNTYAASRKETPAEMVKFNVSSDCPMSAQNKARFAAYVKGGTGNVMPDGMVLYTYNA